MSRCTCRKQKRTLAHLRARYICRLDAWLTELRNFPRSRFTLGTIERSVANLYPLCRVRGTNERS